MRDLHAIADRVEIEALRAEFSDAAMMGDTDRIASLYTEDGVYRIPAVNIEQSGREAIRAGTEQRYRRTPQGWKFTERVMRSGISIPHRLPAPRRSSGKRLPCGLEKFARVVVNLRPPQWSTRPPATAARPLSTEENQ
ncbi:YybH family protein [Nocardia carnea]|nr:SgcJ/EcaC family oxidoreductase [Nocardia carnea]